MEFEKNQLIVGNELQWTGERLTTNVFDEVAMEHMARYAFCIHLAKNKIVLDIGCGEGYGVNILASYAQRIVGVDVDKACINQAIRKYAKPNVEFLAGEATELPFSDASFDVVVSFETIEHLEAHEKMLQEIKRVLRPGGIAVISTPDKFNYSIKRNYVNPFHKKELTRDEFKSLLKRHFIHTSIFGQQNVYASKIYSLDGTTSGDTEYAGSFENIEQVNKFQNPMYLIALTSDSPLPDIQTMYFHGDEFLQKKEARVRSAYENALSYKIGRMVTAPARALRNIFKNNAR